MIIARIGNAKYKLNKLEDAEALLRILSSAQLLETSYDDEYRDYAYVSDGESAIEIQIKQGERIVSYEEHLVMAGKRKNKDEELLKRKAPVETTVSA